MLLDFRPDVGKGDENKKKKVRKTYKRFDLWYKLKVRRYIRIHDV